MPRFAVFESKEQIIPDPFSIPGSLIQGQVGSTSEYEETRLVQRHFPSFSITSLQLRDHTKIVERPLVESDVDLLIAFPSPLAWYWADSAVTWRRLWAVNRISRTQPSISETLVPPTQLALLE